MIETDVESPTEMTNRNRLLVTLSLPWIKLLLTALIVGAALASLRKPPYGVGRWEWYTDPLITRIHWVLTGTCPQCGLKIIHKPGCTEGRQ